MINKLVVLVSVLVLCGCVHERVVYQDVYHEVKVPVPCAITPPTINARNNDEVLDMADIAEYTNALKAALEACTNETTE